MPRPAVDVVVPFLGHEDRLAALLEGLRRLRLRDGDTLVVVDNTPGPRPRRLSATRAQVVWAPERRTPGYARNRGASLGRAPWLVFFDADTEPAADLLDRYFEPSPHESTGLLGGGVRDEPVPARAAAAARYAYLRASMSQDDTFRFGRWGFPKSANIAVRRSTFEALGGFRDDIRAAEDADFSFRLRTAGWTVERRERAVVIHRGRQTLRSFARQKALHGAGGAWLDRQYPGTWPPRRRSGLTWWAVRSLAVGTAVALVRRDRDRALWAVFEPVEVLASEFGRSLPNERPLSLSVLLSAIRRLRPPRNVQRI